EALGKASLKYFAKPYFVIASPFLTKVLAY
ncbi:unnamed protein product, partial [marine sediment metagenome]